MKWPNDYVNKIICGDCLDVMRDMSDNSVDAVVTDPPYGLSFMGKDWDHSVPGVPYWAEALRACKPGAYLLAFGGTRTHHRLTCAIEDAGWEIRDCVMWVYGSGFPKSHDVSKAIDKKRNDNIRPVCRFLRNAMDKQGVNSRDMAPNFGFNPRMIDHWAARDTDSQPTVPTWDQWLALKQLLNFDGEMDAEAWRLNGRKGKPGDDWEKREVIGKDTKARSTSGKSALPTMGGKTVYETWNITAPATDAAKQWQGYGTALKPAWEPIVVARKPIEGTVAQNVQKWGVGAMDIDGCRVGLNGEEPPSGSAKRVYKANQYTEAKIYGDNKRTPPKGRFPANLIHDGSDEVVRLFPNSKSPSTYTRKIAGKSTGNSYQNNVGEDAGTESLNFGDSGSASRFFKECRADDSCPLCDLLLCEKRDAMSSCKNINAPDVERFLKTTQATIRSIVPPSVDMNHVANLAQNVKCAGSLCDSCGILIALILVAIKTSDFSREALQVIRDYIGSYKNSILIPSLVSFAGLWGNIDTIPTIQSLSLLFGSVNHAITNYIPETEKTEQKRFLYCPKASRAERERGCEGIGEKVSREWRTGNAPPNIKHRVPDKKAHNNHPTVKPLALMRYLIKLVTREGHVVLDPFMGSGTTGIACTEMNRLFIGIDTSPDYCKIAENRLK